MYNFLKIFFFIFIFFSNSTTLICRHATTLNDLHLVIKTGLHLKPNPEGKLELSIESHDQRFPFLIPGRELYELH